MPQRWTTFQPLTLRCIDRMQDDNVAFRVLMRFGEHVAAHRTCPEASLTPAACSMNPLFAYTSIGNAHRHTPRASSADGVVTGHPPADSSARAWLSACIDG